MKKYIDVAPDLRLPAQIADHGTYDKGDYRVEFDAELNPVTGVYEIRRLAVSALPGADPVNGTILRTVRVQEAFGEVMRKAEFRLKGGGDYVLPYPDKVSADDSGNLTWEPLRVSINKKDADRERREHAARIAAIAKAFGQHELRLIQEILGVSQSTASRLLKGRDDEA